MTQDNTPPGPISNARLLRTECSSNTKRHVFGKLSARSFPDGSVRDRPPFWRGVIELCMKVGTGGVLHNLVSPLLHGSQDRPLLFLTSPRGLAPPPPLVAAAAQPRPPRGTAPPLPLSLTPAWRSSLLLCLVFWSLFLGGSSPDAPGRRWWLLILSSLHQWVDLECLRGDMIRGQEKYEEACCRGGGRRQAGKRVTHEYDRGAGRHVHPSGEQRRVWLH